ncbi:MAG: hypothetical protein ABI863_20045 [Ginsengibacter sp.]
MIQANEVISLKEQALLSLSGDPFIPTVTPAMGRLLEASTTFPVIIFCTWSATGKLNNKTKHSENK